MKAVMKAVNYGYLSSAAYYITVQNVTLIGTGTIRIKENDKILYSFTYENPSILDFTVSITNDRDYIGSLYKLNGIVLFKDPYVKHATIEYDSSFDCETTTFVFVDHIRF